MNRRRWATLLLVLLGADALSAQEGPSGFDPVTGVPSNWTLCHDSQAGNHLCRLFLGGAEQRAGMHVSGTGRWTFLPTDRRHVLKMLAPGASGWPLRVIPAQEFVPPPLAGLGAMYNGVKVVVVTDDGQRVLDADEPSVEIGPTEWAGVRTRFWAWLIQPADGSLAVSLDETADGVPGIAFSGGDGNEYRVYAGPVDRATLVTADPVLDELLYAALWDWLRWLCFGVAWLYGMLLSILGSPGIAVVALSLSVKVLLLPLTRIADRWQSDINRIQALLQPQLDEIKANHRGEKANDLTLAVYREHGVHPLYTLRSLAGVLIQIPVFIAAFDTLGESFTLHGAGFLWISDLAWPDAVASLPIVIPFFGATLNLLPFAMTAMTVTATILQQEADLTPELQRRQQLRLYAMALAFFILLYAFPAGMVLYWTTSNLGHLAKLLIGRVWPP